MPVPPLLSRLGLDEAGRRGRLEFLQLGPEDEARLVAIREFAHAHVDEIVDDFYAHLLSFNETRALLGGDEQIARLKKLQREFFLRMMEGRFDAEYFESRLRVGAAHARSDLAPQWYLGAYNLYIRLLMERLRAHHHADPDRLLALLVSLCKAIFLDLGLAVDAYILSGFVDRTLAQEYRRMAEVAERTLREKAELERAKADLTSMIVHDLKGPLAGILTVVQLALRKRDDADPSVRHFQQIQRSARDLMRMIENLLDVDRLEEGRLELRVEPVSLYALLDECAAEFHAAAEVAGQAIEVAVADDVAPVMTDRWLLRRVLTNLLINAIRHSGSAGSIRLAAELDGGKVCLSVRDGGRGIPQEAQATLFAKKARGHESGERNREDTGLGLVFCKLAVGAMGGTIDVTSAPGEGATFTVILPIAAEPN